MKKNTRNPGMTFHEHLRFVIELEIARDKLIEFRNDILQRYPKKIYSTIPLVFHPLGETIKLCMEKKYLSDCDSQHEHWERDLYNLALGCKIFPSLQFSILSESKIGEAGLVVKKGKKKTGFSLSEHDRAGYMLQSIKDFFHHQSINLWGVYCPDREPAEVCIQRCCDIGKLQQKMAKVFLTDHPDQPDHVAEQTYLRDKHPDYAYLNDSFTDLRPFTSLIKSELAERARFRKEVNA